MKKIGNKKKSTAYAAVICLVVLLTAGIIVLTHHTVNRSNVSFVIDGTEYTKQVVQPLVAVTMVERSLSRTAATQQIYGYMRDMQAAQKAGITLDDGLLKTVIESNNQALRPITKIVLTTYATNKGDRNTYQPVFPKGPTMTPYLNLWLQLVSYHDALQQTLDNAPQGQYKGYSFAFDFSDKIVPERPTGSVPGHGDAALIKIDDAYALKQATLSHEQIVTHKITPEALLEMMKKDTRLGQTDNSVSFSVLLSSQFDNSGSPYLEQDIFYKDAVDYVQTQSRPGVSEVKLAKLTTSKGQRAPAAYYFVVLTKAIKPTGNTDQAFQQNRQDQKVKYYGI